VSRRVASLLAEAFGDLSPLQQELDAFADDLQRRYPALTKPHVYVRGEPAAPNVYVQSIEVGKDQRGQGTGSKVMQEIQQWAKDHKLPILLSPEPERGHKGGLDRFYSRLGFKSNLGRKGDSRFSGSRKWTPESVVNRLLEDLADDDEAAYAQDPDPNEARATMLFGQHVGLNADWSVTAWFLGPGKANRTSGAYYLTDNEDGTWSIVQRYYEDDDGYHPATGGVNELFTSEVFNDVLERAREIRDQHRAGPVN